MAAAATLTARRRRPIASSQGRNARRLKKVPREEVEDYGFRFGADRHLLVPSREPDEYVLEIKGQVFWSGSEAIESAEPKPVVVGEMTAYLIQAGRACNDGVPLVEVCDCHSQELLDVVETLYDLDEERLKDSVSEGCNGADLLVLSRLLILPEHRGRRLGQLAILRAIEDCGTGVAAAACKPFPIQSERHRTSDESVYKLADFGTDRDSAIERLRRYWGELGFKQVSGSDWFAMDLAYQHPGFQDLVSDL